MKFLIKRLLIKLIFNKLLKNLLINKVINEDIFIEGNKYFDFSKINENDLDKLFKKTSYYWRNVGSKKKDIYYSVLTHEKYRKVLSDVEKKNFLENGNEDIKDALNYAEKFSKTDRIIKSVLDFGCGVGRLSYNLPLSMPEICCCDFSKIHLEEAKANLSERFKDSKIHFKYLPDIFSICDLPKQDLIFSFLTLQHNTPPVINYLIYQLLNLLNKDGIAVLHIPLANVNYQFDFEEYLRSKKSGKLIEMHLLPRSNLYKCALDCDCELVFSECKGHCGAGIYSEYVIFRKN